MSAPGPAAAAPENPYHRGGAEFVALGDSYIDTGSYSTLIPGSCTQATDSVARLIAADMPQTSFGDWGCGGADTHDITERTAMGPQVDGLSDAARYVAVSIGGNDESLFGDLIHDCFVAATCTPNVRAAAQDKLTRLPQRLDAAFTTIRQRAPHAKIVALGYLKILPDDPTGCFVEAIAGRTGVAFSNTVQNALNGAISAAAARAGFVFVDPDAPGDHSICAPIENRYVTLTGLEPDDGGTPFHPTRLGRKYMAAKAVAAMIG
ncbi:GDSL-type esterase/lipase family protein [Nocardia africana]